MAQNFWENSLRYTGPALTRSMIERAELLLGLALPSDYTALLHGRNGGVPLRRCFFTNSATSWASDHFEIAALLGIGGDQGIDSAFGSDYMIREWGYPRPGVVICETPSAEHDTVMLDYRTCGPQGTPSVMYFDEEHPPLQVAANFAEFIEKLELCPP